MTKLTGKCIEPDIWENKDISDIDNYCNLL